MADGLWRAAEAIAEATEQAYFLTQKDRDALARAHDQNLKKPLNNPVKERPSDKQRSPEVYVAVPPKGEGIPARTGDLPGHNECCIFRLKDDGLGNFRLEPILSRVDGKQIRENVYNIYDTAVTPAFPPNEYYIRIHRGKDGKWLCEPPIARTVTGPTSTTTTTPRIYYAGCAGKCKWTWDNTDKLWTQVSSTCSTSTTTTSTTSTTTTTPCLCETTSTSSSSTTSTSTTTTTPYSCTCAHPTFCGTVTGDCTYTNCVTIPTQAHDCGQSTTSTSTTTTTTTTSTSTTTTTPSGTTTSSTSTTTTTPNCDTTTTACGNRECKWVASKSICDVVVWTKVLDCGRVPFSDQPSDGTCECESAPSGGAPCDTYVSPCVRTTTTSTTTTTQNLGCPGVCWWLWNPGLFPVIDPFGGGWMFYEDPICGGETAGCAPIWANPGAPNGPSPYGCGCAIPTIQGTSCGMTTTRCVSTGTTSSTSSTTTTPHPCYPPSSTTSTSSSTTTSSTSTTTTTGCTTEKCIWRSNADHTDWTLGSSTCPDVCPCAKPIFLPTNSCQKQETPCGGGTTSSTTTSTTSTTSTTTTTPSGTTTSTTTTTTTTSTSTTTPSGCHDYSITNFTTTLPNPPFSTTLNAQGIGDPTPGAAHGTVIEIGNDGNLVLDFSTCGISNVSFDYYKEAAMDDCFAGVFGPGLLDSRNLNVNNTWTHVSMTVTGGTFISWATAHDNATSFLYIDNIVITNVTDP